MYIRMALLLINTFFSFHFFSVELQLSYLTEEIHQGIAIIGLNKPETRNAFNRSIVKKLSDVLDVLAHDRNVRVVIIRSMLANVFCSGADLKERSTLTPVEVQRFVTSLRVLFKRFDVLLLLN